MSNRKKQRMIIGVLSVILIGMAVGYGAINQLLKINGTSGIANNFNVQITKIEENTMKDATTITTSGIGTTEANFTVDLKKPGSSAIYNITVENKGNIEAMVSAITGLDESNSTAPLDIKYSISGIKVGDSIGMKSSMTFQVKVEWDINSTSIPTTTKSLTLKLDYEQYVGPTPTDEACFTIDETGTITGYNCEETDVVIPKTINGTQVTAIGADSMKSKGLTSVVMQKGVTEIGDRAFAFNQLTNVEIPNSITSIGNGVFFDCLLTNVILPNSVTSIGNNTFDGNQLTSMDIPDSVTSIGNHAFANNQLTSVEIPNSVESIGEFAFNNNQITSIVIPNSVKNIGNRAFGSNQLTSVTIGTGVTKIGDYVFYDNQLTSIDIPDSVKNIGDGAFQINQLTDVVIPNNVESIGNNAFQNNQLTSVTIGTGVTTIVWNAFWVDKDSNPNLTRIVNKTGRPFNWYDITGQGTSSSAVTGTYGQVVVSAS